jgi:hypothetical protein
MTPRIMVHHSCCSETPFLSGPEAPGGGFLIHLDGTVSKFPPSRSLTAVSGEIIHIFLIGYFNSCSCLSAADSRQVLSLAELLRQLLYGGGELFDQLICHHQFCPGYRFPWEELEWRLWKMLS